MQPLSYLEATWKYQDQMQNKGVSVNGYQGLNNVLWIC